jgi:hypothetical protein
MQPPQQPLQFHRLDKSLFAERAEALDEIVLKYKDSENHTDRTTKKLIDWADTFLDKMYPHSNESIEKIIEFANPFFYTLNYEILRDDLRSAPDNSKVFTIDDTPVIGHEYDRTWLWSERVYKRCLRACNKKSPIDGGPMEENPEVHIVAKAFIDWKAPLFPRSYEGTSALAPPPTETDLLIERTAFQRLGAFANAYRMAKDGVEETDTILTDADASQQAAFAVLMQARARAEQEKKILIDEKEALKTQYDANLRQLDEQATTNEVLRKAQMEKLEKEIKDAKATSKAIAEDQKKRLEKLELEDRKTKETTQKEKEDLRRFQEMKIKEINDRQTANEHNQQTLIAQMQKNHAQAFNAFIAQMGNNTAEVEALKQSLAKQTQTSMMQEGMIIGLKDHATGLARDLAAARGGGRGRGKRRGGCSPM